MALLVKARGGACARSRRRRGHEVEDVELPAGVGEDDGTSGRYDLVIEVEMGHDLSRPVDALATMRRVLAPGGAALAVEEKVADTFTPGHPVDRFMYAFGLLACLPVAMAEQPSAATGTVMRQHTFRELARQAGFRAVEALDIELPLQRLIP